MPTAKGYVYTGEGFSGDPLVRLKSWPRIALARSIVDALEQRGIRLDTGRIPAALVADFPVDHRDALFDAGMLLT